MNFIHVWQITDYDWASGEYSSWTESRWETFAMRIFLKPSPWQEWVVFSVGLVILLLSVIATYWLNSKADVLFPNR
jgi:nicastrin